MRHSLYITLVISLVLAFAVEIAAQERNYLESQTGMGFRGKTIQLTSKRNPDGTYTDTYHDTEGNPLSELERQVMQGNEKLGNIRSASQSFATTHLTGLLGERETPSPIFIIGSQGLGENPEFRVWLGITLEQVRKMRLAAWDFVDFPSDEMVDIFVRAAATEDAEELKTLVKERNSLTNETFKKANETLLAELSPEQIQKLWEMEWLMPSSSAFTGDEEVSINLGRYNAFDLSEEQKKRIEALKKELLQAAPELDKLRGQEYNQKLIELVKATRTKLRDTLTATQRAKLDRLQTEKPKFLTAQPAPKKEEWMPGPNSWKPGDPLPEGVLPPRPPRGRFPPIVF
jgi:hypothetical protein